MKRIITLLAALAIASAAHAQTDSLVIFDTQGDNLGISIAGFNITLGDDGSSSSGKAAKPKVKRVTTNFVGLSFGANAFTYKPNYGNWAGENQFMTDNTSSWRFGVEAFGVQVSLDRNQKVFFKASLNSTVDRYRFNNAMTLVNDENGALMPEPLSGTVKKSKMLAGYLGIGAGLGFKISQVLLMFDFNTDLLTSSYVKYKNPGKTQYDISGLSNIRYRTGVAATVSGFGIYADYALTPLYREDVGNHGQVLSIGIRCGF